MLGDAASQNDSQNSIESVDASDIEIMTVPGAVGKSKTTKRKNSSQMDSEENILLKKALIALDKPERIDEWDVFGQFVAADLRRISNLTYRNAAKCE